VSFTREGDIIIGVGTPVTSVASRCPDVVPAPLARPKNFGNHGLPAPFTRWKLDRLAPGA
jgi:hypothetical protein